MNNTVGTGNLIIVSGPSGAGKSALVMGVLARMTQLKFSVSYTTRAPRGKEQHGIEYFFVDRDEFQELIKSGSLLEWAEVHGNLYGTSGEFVGNLLQKGNDVILDVDIQGAQTMRQQLPDAIAVFILPPSYQVLRERLLKRSLDDEPVIEQRLRIACKEISNYRNYDYLIINENLENSTQELESIISGARCRMKSRMEAAQSILTTFGGMDAENS